MSTQEPITLEMVVEMARALGRHKDVVYWPPLTLRGSVKECHDHGYLHWHWEAVATLPGHVIAHLHDPEPYSSPEVACAVLEQFARKTGHPDIELYEHSVFVHTMEPEVRQMEESE